MCIEIWKPVAHYEGIYQINNFGDLKSLERIGGNNHHIKEKIISQQLDKLGYYKVTLTKNGKCKHVLVHRLVAEHFIPDKSTFKSMLDEDRSLIDLDKLEVNHKDENKQNNNVNNLEWCTHKYNSNYGTRTERIIPKTIDKTRTPVDQCDENWNVIKEWYSTNEAARSLKIAQQNITKCCQGNRHHAGGFRWKYHNCKKEVIGE
jgi:hypothetical protein